MSSTNAVGGASLLPHHTALLAGSALRADVVSSRGYCSVTRKSDLRRLGFAERQLIVPTLLVPIHNVAGELATYQHRPDMPRIVNGKALKYETPRGARMVLDVPPIARAALGDPRQPLFVTEGSRKADAAVSAGLCCVALLGVWNWRGTNADGGKVALADWDSIAIKERTVYVVFDSDVMQKPPVHCALVRLRAFIASRGGEVRLIYLPSGEGASKVGLDDYLAASHTLDDLLALATREVRGPRVTDVCEATSAEEGTHPSDAARGVGLRNAAHGGLR